MIRNTGTRFVALGINLYDRVADKNIMALYSELPVYWDVYKLHLMIFECTKDFSKEYKYTLGQDINRGALQLVRNTRVNTGKAIYNQSIINSTK